jgi:GNAT superfamily N-acetyltransferase
VDGLRIERAELTSDVALTLIAALNAELSALYPEPGANHFTLNVDEVAPGRGGFFVAYVDGAPVGCGAVRQIQGAEAEIKRMYVAPALRSRGVGGLVLQALEAEARALGATRLVLETGERQPAAIHLYEKLGFQVIPPFGEYVGSPLSVCMAKDL